MARKTGKTKKAAKAKGWRSVFGPDEVIQRIRPEDTDEYLDNPHKGTATFQRFNGDAIAPDLRWDDTAGPESFPPPKNRDLHNDRYPPTRVSYCRWLWSALEPEKGKFRWEFLDGALRTAAERGQTLQVRTQPFIGTHTPEWYWRTGARYDRRHYAADGVKVPCHNDPLYLEHWGDHIRAIGRRYDGHAALESFDVAYGGSCGETGGNTSNANAEKLVDVYLDAFRKTQLLTMLGTHGCLYAPETGRNVGWRADCYGDVRTDGQGVVPEGLCWGHMLDAYPKEVAQCGVADAYRTAPVVLETCWTVAHWYNEGWDIDWIIDQGYKYHVSVFMPKNVYIPEPWYDRIMAFNKRMGYRFRLQQMLLPLEARPRRRVRVEATIDNCGVAPIYRPYRFALRFSQGRRHHVVALRQDIRRWMPDLTFFSDRFTFPRQLRRGPAAVSCAIVDDDDRPVVRLAVKARDADGWHPLTHMDVL